MISKILAELFQYQKNLNKSMVLYLTTWQEVPDDPQQTDTMITKPE